MSVEFLYIWMRRCVIYAVRKSSTFWVSPSVTRFVQILAKLNFCFPNGFKFFKPRLSYLLLITATAQPCCMWAQGSSTSPAAWVCRFQAFFNAIPIFKAPSRLKYYAVLPTFFYHCLLAPKGTKLDALCGKYGPIQLSVPPFLLVSHHRVNKRGGRVLSIPKWETLAFCIPFKFRGGGGGLMYYLYPDFQPVQTSACRRFLDP